MNALWFTARGAGLTAMLVLSLATALGALGSAGIRSAASRVVLQHVHRTAALLGIALIVVHVSAIVLDTRSHIGVTGALVPFSAGYRPDAVAAGSIAAYLFLLAAALGLARGRFASSSRAAGSWRALHGVSYLAWALAIGHGFTAGTDAHQPWVRLLTIGCVAGVIVAGLVRFVGADDEVDVTPPRRALAGRLPR